MARSIARRKASKYFEDQSANIIIEQHIDKNTVRFILFKHGFKRFHRFTALIRRREIVEILEDEDVEEVIKPRSLSRR